ncbi:MAG: hypothetical protein JRJ60_21880, partial [Deltaproteobacteria bacterium]|nr:hypothetical protein [Deltaproteobacteria bacterium]
MKTHARNWMAITVAVMLAGFLAGCGSGGGGDDGGPGATASIALSSSATEIPADGASSCTISASIADSAGAAVLQNTDVRFSTTLGRFINGSTTYDIKTPDDSGTVSVSLIAWSEPGTANVTVSSKGVSQRIQVDFTGGKPGVPVAEAFGVVAEYLNISGLWLSGLEDQITAYLADALGQAVAGVDVEFKTYNTGGFMNPPTAIADSGFAVSTLTSTPNPTPLEGFVSVTAETQGGPTTRVSAIGVTPYPYQHIMYAGTAGGGVYKSSDWGHNWVNVSRSTANPEQGQNWIDPYVKGHTAVCVDPDDVNTVYVGTGYLGEGSIFRSLDGGLNWNSNHTEEVFGLYNTTAAVLTVLCDGGGSDWVWAGTEGKGPLFAADGVNFQPSTGTVSTPVAGAGNVGDGFMTDPILSYSSQTETWTATCYVPEDASATIPD